MKLVARHQHTDGCRPSVNRSAFVAFDQIEQGLDLRIAGWTLKDPLIHRLNFGRPRFAGIERFGDRSGLFVKERIVQVIEGLSRH